MTLKEIFTKSAWAIMYLIGTLMLSGTMLYLSTIFSMKGEAETNILRFEIQKQQAYELVDPDSKMSPAREMIVEQAQSLIQQYETEQ